MLGEEEIKHRFGFHKGTPITGPIHQELRTHFIEIAMVLDELVPEGRAKAVMFTELENAAMWGNKAIAEMAPLSSD